MTSDQPARPAMTMRQIREQLGHVKPGQPEVLVSITQYAVSVLPPGDINRKYFTLHVELTHRGWIVTDGHGTFDAECDWTPGRSTAHTFADYDEALAVAKALAPNLTVNGHTAVEAYHRTHPAAPSV